MAFPIHWRGAREARGWSFAVALTIAIVIHLPLTPFALLWKLLGVVLSGSDDWDYKDDTVIVPISLDLDPKSGSVESSPPPPAAPAGGQAAAAAAAAHAPDAGTRDAGAADAGKHPPRRDAGRLADADPNRDTDRRGDGAVRGANAGTDAATGDGGGVAGHDSQDGGGGIASAADGSAHDLRDRLGLAGALEKVTKGKANIELALWLSELRGHPLGSSFAEILTCSPQWRDFLGDGVVDPLRDFDSVQLSGPQFADTSRVTAVVKTRLDKAHLRAIVAGLVAQSGSAGGFVADAGVGEIVARIHADRADRVIVTHPRDLVFVTPPEGYEQIARQHQPLAMPDSKGRAGALTLVNPWRPLRRIGLALPQTLSEMTLEAKPTADGGIDVDLAGEDVDEDTAARDAPSIQSQLGAFALLVGEIPVRAEGARVTASFHLSGFATSLLLGMARAQICPMTDAGSGLEPRPRR